MAKINAGDIFVAYEGGFDDEPDEQVVCILRALVDADIDELASQHQKSIGVDDEGINYDFAHSFVKWLVSIGLFEIVPSRTLHLGSWGRGDVHILEQKPL